MRRRLVAAVLALAASQLWAFDAGSRTPVAAAGTVEVAFSPWDDAEGVVLRAIGAARREIFVQAFLFTSRSMARALVEAKGRGVAVTVLADREMTVKGDNSQVPSLAAAGIPVFLEVRYQAAHNKVMIIDPGTKDAAIITGSMNFTYSAVVRNAENVLVLRGNPALTRAYLDNWHRHRADALPYGTPAAEQTR